MCVHVHMSTCLNLYASVLLYGACSSVCRICVYVYAYMRECSVLVCKRCVHVWRMHIIMYMCVHGVCINV